MKFQPDHVVRALYHSIPRINTLSPGQTAAVLFLIQYSGDMCAEPHLLLNKRSNLVKQPGDLCCPGGRVHPHVDTLLGYFLNLPFAPLARSRGWRVFSKQARSWRQSLSRFWACSLRESWEEMGLLPWRVEFLGMLPLDQLRLFKRTILPLVGWISEHRSFRPNWEVEKIVPVPISSLLEPSNYSVYVLHENIKGPNPLPQGQASFPCFVHRGTQGEEILWGATYRIVMSFLERVYDFDPPAAKHLRVTYGRLSSGYLTGKTRNE
jgi:8-oxo-dGTP pyrophosphatase MutT (NUDIX family)